MPPVENDDWESVEQPANWPQLPKHPGYAPQGNHTPWVQPIPINHAGKIAQVQGQPPGWAQPPGNMGFNTQKPSFPWGQLHPVHPAGIGMPAHGHLAALPQHPISPFGYGYGANANGQQANWNGFGTPAGWGGQGHPMGWGAPWAPMGWGNNQGKGQPGILEGLLKVGKGTMGGIGMISGLISMGKFLF
ncbi:hypothetical protein J1P26_14875 [Neobacillus sp. MM2021_6]|nr:MULTISPECIES: hypothetical protein [Bacillaceae]MBO0960982.1 hypothetical protein [Neobacillus sp. MM2021_6]